MTESVNRILPLPYLPTYIARRPKHSKSNEEVEGESFRPIFASNWHKALDDYTAKHRNIYGSPFNDIEVESNQNASKQYDSYKPSYYPQYNLNSIDSFSQIRPLTVPNHTSRTSEKWSRFLDEYPDRFKINYPMPDEDNDFYYPGRYPYQMTKESPNYYSRLTNQIHPVTNPFRQSESRQKSMVTRPIWLPYGTAPRRYQKTAPK